MENITEEKSYSLKDLNRAFNMGLESAVHILESAEKLSREGIKQLTEELKEQLSDQNSES